MICWHLHRLSICLLLPRCSQGCDAGDAGKAARAIAAAHSLQRLRLDSTVGSCNYYPARSARPRPCICGSSSSSPQLQKETVVPELDSLLQLTHCSLSVDDRKAEELIELSTLINLVDLKLTVVGKDGVPGGLPSQLVKLTSLSLDYDAAWVEAEQLQHVGSFTALQQLELAGDSLLWWPADYEHLSCIQSLSQLTRLKLDGDVCFGLTHSITWPTSLTALESLSLCGCLVQAEALAVLTQLKKLYMDCCPTQQSVPYDKLLGAVSKLQLLTELCVVLPLNGEVGTLPNGSCLHCPHGQH
jgi:hypothetical protein